MHFMRHRESHRSGRIGWLRAAVLGANDGIVSTASLVIGVAAAKTGRSDVLLAGVAGLAAGALSMAAGEYVSVSSQSDTERADLDKERSELVDDPQGELQELTGIYVKRGLEPPLQISVARPAVDRGVDRDDGVDVFAPERADRGVLLVLHGHGRHGDSSGELRRGQPAAYANASSRSLSSSSRSSSSGSSTISSF